MSKSLHTPTHVAFVKESNRIEGITRRPTRRELNEFERFTTLNKVTVADLEYFVSIYQPGAEMRDRVGLNVYVGNHRPPPGAPEIRERLKDILKRAKRTRESAFLTHVEYETLHPFMDGNGRSGRALWAWQMQRTYPLGFLHHFYYQSLSFGHQQDAKHND